MSEESLISYVVEEWNKYDLLHYATNENPNRERDTNSINRCMYDYCRVKYGELVYKEETNRILVRNKL
jgi:hypothetical protein